MTAAAEARVVLITGGAQGIGKATAEGLLRAGYRVVIADIDTEAGGETEEEYRPLGDLLFVPCDVGDEDQVRALIERTLAHCGRLDGLVNNAAISRRRPLLELEGEDWQRVLATNLTGPYLLSRFAAPALRSHRGAIVNIASTRALMSEPDTEAYSASKGGVVALTHALAASLAPEVRVNCISPGWIETGPWKKRGARRAAQHSARDREQHWSGRVGRPEDVAALIAYLLSDAAGFITGANFVVDGGMTRKMIYAE